MSWLSNILFLDAFKVLGDTDYGILSNLYYTYLVQEANESEPHEFTTKQKQQNFNEKEKETKSKSKNDKVLGGEAYNDNVEYIFENAVVAEPKDFTTKKEKQNFEETNVNAEIEKDMNQTKTEDSDRCRNNSRDIMKPVQIC